MDFHLVNLPEATSLSAASCFWNKYHQKKGKKKIKEEKNLTGGTYFFPESSHAEATLLPGL